MGDCNSLAELVKFAHLRGWRLLVNLENGDGDGPFYELGVGCNASPLVELSTKFGESFSLMIVATHEAVGKYCQGLDCDWRYDFNGEHFIDIEPLVELPDIFYIDYDLPTLIEYEKKVA
jgi:hypothetical protein